MLSCFEAKSVNILIFNFFEENRNYFMTLFLLKALFHGT